MTEIRTITDEQIDLLREEAIAAGDVEQARLCNVARNATGDWTTAKQRADARAECAKAIAAAAAQRDDVEPRGRR